LARKGIAVGTWISDRKYWLAVIIGYSFFGAVVLEPLLFSGSGPRRAIGLVLLLLALLALIPLYYWLPKGPSPKGQRTDEGTANPPPPSSSEASRTGSNLDELERLASLRDKGIITEEEFNAKKKQLLDL
jgi:hypothetical protein